MNVLWMDTETTGLLPAVNSIIEIAAAIESDGVTSSVIHEFARPCESSDLIDPVALSVNGHSIEQIMEYQDPSIVVSLLIAALDPYVKDDSHKFILAGHHVSFDRDFLSEMFRRAGHIDAFKRLFSHNTICTKVLVNVFKHNGWIDIDSSSLEAVAAHYDLVYKPHSAISDVSAARRVYGRMIQTMNFFGV